MDYSAIDDLGEESDAQNSSGNEWQGDDDEDDNELEGADEEISEDDSIANGEVPSLIVKLKYGKRKASSDLKGPEEPPAEKPETSELADTGVTGDTGNLQTQETMVKGLEEPSAMKLETGEPSEAGPIGNTEKLQTQETMVNGAEGTKHGSTAMAESKPFDTLATDNTDVEEEKAVLQNGPNGV